MSDHGEKTKQWIKENENKISFPSPVLSCIAAQATANHRLLLDRFLVRERTATDVASFHIRIVSHLPTRTHSPTAIIHLLVPIEEPFIEEADRVDQLSTNDEIGSHNLIHVLRFFGIKICMEIAVDRSEIRQYMRQFQHDEKLIEKPRKPSHRRLSCSIGINKTRSGNADVRVLI